MKYFKTWLCGKLNTKYNKVIGKEKDTQLKKKNKQDKATKKEERVIEEPHNNISDELTYSENKRLKRVRKGCQRYCINGTAFK